MRSAMWRSAGIGLASVLLVLNSPVGAQSPDRFVPFSEFMQGLRGATPSAYVGQGQNRVASPRAFEEMRQHLLSMYDDITVRQSHVLDSQHYDCVPVMQQPSVRALGISQLAPTPPAAHAPEGGGRPSGSDLAPQFAQSTDKFGNSIDCAPGTVPMRRMTLDDLARFPTLQQYFQKGPNGAGQAPGGVQAPVAATHKYAHAYQYVTNYGGSSNLALYRPSVNTAAGQVFSLSQHWYVNFQSGKTQTVEVGWQKFPQFYGTTNPVLFIYFTADGYNKTGCYNLTCKAFVQTNNSIHIGAGWSQYSTIGGAQKEVQLGYVLYNGNWWLRYGSTYVGYYPGSLWGNANLSRFAQEIDYGGETVGTTSWPQMGSGRFASQGYPYAAFQRLIYYYATNGGTRAYYAALTKQQPSPHCYTINAFTGNATWHTYFFFGGPGGTGC